MKGLIREQECRNCKFAYSEPGQLFCRRMPPSATPILAAGPDGRPIVLGAVANFPPMQPNQWCGEWVRGFKPVGFDSLPQVASQ